MENLAIKSVNKFTHSPKYCIKFDSKTARIEYPELSQVKYAYIIGALDKVCKQHFRSGKLDLIKFYAFLKTMYPYKKTFAEMKSTLLELSPMLNIIDSLSLTKKESGELKYL